MPSICGHDWRFTWKNFHFDFFVSVASEPAAARKQIFLAAGRHLNCQPFQEPIRIRARVIVTDEHPLDLVGEKRRHLSDRRKGLQRRECPPAHTNTRGMLTADQMSDNNNNCSN